ncbi:MAG: hypothetical protein DMG09_27680 [Acidobacteria bacterium]|nr:MAG: hypothetical protein DMG09_27680 [Acidobacteriota bacterium]
MESILSHSFAGVFRRPDCCTLATESVALDPLGITTLPPTTTSFETLPAAFCPVLASLELTDCSSLMITAIPAGIVSAYREAAGPQVSAAMRNVPTIPRMVSLLLFAAESAILSVRVYA